MSGSISLSNLISPAVDNATALTPHQCIPSPFFLSHQLHTLTGCYNEEQAAHEQANEVLEEEQMHRLHLEQQLAELQVRIAHSMGTLGYCFSPLLRTPGRLILSVFG